jgi:hypothetical protein
MKTLKGQKKKKKIENPPWIFFKRNPGINEVLEDKHWTQRGLCWKMTKLYRTYLQYTGCKKLFKVFIWLTLVYAIWDSLGGGDDDVGILCN